MNVGTQVHTSPAPFGNVMSETKPRMAVAYHFFNDWDTAYDVEERIRKAYDGKLSLANDFMVWNVTKDKITTRMAVTEEATWAPPLGAPEQKPSLDDRTAFAAKAGIDPDKIGFGELTKSGFWDVDDVLKPIYEEEGKKRGKTYNYPDPTKKPEEAKEPGN